MANIEQIETKALANDIDVQKIFGIKYPNPDRIASRTSTVTRAMASTLAPILEAKNEKELLDMAALLYYSVSYDKLTDDKHKGRCRRIVAGEETVTCVYCGRPAKDLDHLFPLVEKTKPSGYCTEPVDLVPCCSDCNESKGSKCWYVYMDISDHLLKLVTKEAKEFIHKYLKDDVTKYLFKGTGGLESDLNSYYENHKNERTEIIRLIKKAKDESQLSEIESEEITTKIIDQIIKKNIARDYLHKKMRDDVDVFVKNKNDSNNHLLEFLDSIINKKKRERKEETIYRLLEDGLHVRKKNLKNYCESFGLPSNENTNTTPNLHMRKFVEGSSEHKWWKHLQKQINDTLDIAQLQIDAFNAGVRICRDHNYPNSSEEELVTAYKQFIGDILQKTANDKLYKILHGIGINSSVLHEISRKEAKIKYIEGLEAFIMGFKYEKGLKVD